MKVALVGTLPEADRAAHRGPERVTIGLGNALEERGHSVTVVADEGSPRWMDTSETAILCPDATPGVDRLVRFWRAIQRSLDLDAYDLIHAWRPAPSVDVLSLHSVGHAGRAQGMDRPDLRTRLGARIERFAKRRVARNADRVVVTAPRNARDAANHGFQVDATIPVGCAERFIASDKSNDGPKRILSVGRVEPAKRQHVAALAAPGSCETRVAGPITDSTYAERVRAVGAKTLGELEQSSLIREYRRADVVVVPATQEGFSLTAVEALAAETPVVVTNGCGIADLVRQHRVGAVAPTATKSDLSTAIARVLADRERYVTGTQEMVRERLTWPAIAEQYEELYSECVGVGIDNKPNSRVVVSG